MIKKSPLIVSLAIAAVIAGTPLASLAQTPTSTTSSSTIQAQFDIITQLLKQIDAIKAQIASLRQQQTQLAQQTRQNVTQLVTMLHEGSFGDNVKILQALLAADPTIYPEGKITGYFGKLTSSAVKRYQKKHGFEQVGNVGPKTLKKLNDDLKENQVSLEDSEDSTEGKRPCAIVPPGHLIAPGWLKKHDGVRPVVPACQTLPPGIAKKLGTSTSTPTSTPTTTDTVAPVISSVATSSIASSTATVSWNTNEPATGKIYYGTSTPLSLGTATNVSDATLFTSHSIGLTGLAASSTYYFVVESKDASNNTATSSEMSFVTSN